MTPPKSVGFMRALNALALGLVVTALTGCAKVGRLNYVSETVIPAKIDSTELEAERHRKAESRFGPMFGDTLIGLVPGTADSTRRYLGRLRDGYTADTLNIFLLGDNRPGKRTSRLAPQYFAIKEMLSLNPVKFVKGLVAIPVGLVRGLVPDLAILRDIPDQFRHQPTSGREREVLSAMLNKVDSLRARGQMVSAVINTGDLVEDGRYPAQWERFLKLHQPLTSRVPYFGVAGNHERTDTEEGIANWRTATGLPVGGDRLYYCFDSADGWVRFIALDSNPLADPANLWSREVQIKYSEEQIAWMVARIREHTGPAFVFMHHPPFSVGFHRVEWQADSVLRDRRERMVHAMHEAGIGVLATGHEHAYERALFTWSDAVLISIVTGGGGSPLHAIPSPSVSARMFSQYKVAGATVDPEHVVTGSYFHFVHVRLWFGGGSLHTYAVDKQSKTTLADMVTIDLKRYGVPQIDERKMPIPAKVPTSMGPHEEVLKKPNAARVDTVANSKRILTTPPPKAPSKRPTRRGVTVRDSVAAARRDSIATVKRDSLAARRKKAAPAAPIRPPRR